MSTEQINLSKVLHKGQPQGVAPITPQQFYLNLTVTTTDLEAGV